MTICIRSTNARTTCSANGTRTASTTKGHYRRVVLRRIILDALLAWIDDPKSRTPRAERLFDAAAALCGTMLMASSISGSGPGVHDSSVTLTSLAAGRGPSPRCLLSASDAAG